MHFCGSFAAAMLCPVKAICEKLYCAGINSVDCAFETMRDAAISMPQTETWRAFGKVFKD
jgi:hypothetical protein